MLNQNKNFFSQLLRDKRGFAAFYLTILILAVVSGIAVSIFILTYGELKIVKNIVKSNQAYYIAEAGVEDAILRLSKKIKWSSPYTIIIEDGKATVEISEIIGGSRTITSKGEALNRIRKISAVYGISAEAISFYYGAQVGDGGIKMQDTAKINGNVYSNGSIIKLGGNPEITKTAIVAKNGNQINGLKIGVDAKVYSCIDSNITGTLTYVQGGSAGNCSASAINSQIEEIPPKDLPISQSQIDQWKKDAVAGGTISDDYILKSKQEVYLGPKKIEGNLIVQDTAKLWLTGTIWVTGNITLQNNGQIRLDPATYGSLSGIILADGKITIPDSTEAKGTGQAGSYLMLLSTLDSILTGSDAIVVQNSPKVDIIYASQGYILLQDSIILREVCSYGLKLQNKATVIYETGLADASFSSGPGGGWQVANWKEIE